MKENTVYNVLIAVSLIAIIVVTVLIFTTRTTEPFTELYFEDHLNLPKEIELNKDYSFQFTVHNMENQKIDYTYKIGIQGDEPFPKTINIGFTTLEGNETRTIKQFFRISKEFQTARIIVELEGREQEIHFWVKPK